MCVHTKAAACDGMSFIPLEASKQFGVFAEVRSFALILCSSSFQIVPGGGSAAKEGAEFEGISGALILGLEFPATRKVAAGFALLHLWIKP